MKWVPIQSIDATLHTLLFVACTKYSVCKAAGSSKEAPHFVMRRRTPLQACPKANGKAKDSKQDDTMTLPDKPAVTLLYRWEENENRQEMREVQLSQSPCRETFEDCRSIVTCDTCTLYFSPGCADPQLAGQLEITGTTYKKNSMGL